VENELAQEHATPVSPSESPWPWSLFAIAFALGIAAAYHYYELYSSLAEPIPQATAAAERK
jgi:hypothetical protein